MMPLVYAAPGEENVIKKVGGNPDVKRHLENLGFTPGGSVTLVNILGGNVIVKVKESRIALNEDMARKVMV
ncbi:MAG: ferrous iron transport protein A [Lachnospiraceae bacterium]|nr:ferrous iron transport protein A [Lachnospiraceae bacterium]